MTLNSEHEQRYSFNGETHSICISHITKLGKLVCKFQSH